MKALVFGNGAREHALAARLVREGWELVVAPGTAGIARRTPCRPVLLDDAPGCVALARALAVDLAVVGPEAPLVAGLGDALRAAGILTFGPSAAAARIEGSKAFSKEVMLAAGVPTAQHAVFEDFESARKFARARAGLVAVKADGLAAGKGVVVCGTVEAADAALAALLRLGGRLVVEERLSGPEVSLLALCDGRSAVGLPLAHDYKRLREGDQGPNTGGMGVVAPTSRGADAQGLVDLAVRPVLTELARRGTPFSGLLFAGLMLTPDGPRVLEYNCRFGDPETQGVLQVVEGPLGEALAAVARGRIEGRLLSSSGKIAVGVVAAAPGYPEQPRVGAPIAGWAEAEGKASALYAAGVSEREGTLVTSGGRVATLVGVGRDLAAARAQAYEALACLSFAGLQFRGDVGGQDVAP